MTKTKTSARETREKHEKVARRGLLLFFVLNFELWNFGFVSNFVLRVSCFLLFSRLSRVSRATLINPNISFPFSYLYLRRQSASHP